MGDSASTRRSERSHSGGKPERRVTLSELATKATGTWTFDAQGFPWTADDTITVPLKYDANGGASIYSARTRPTFTNCAGTV
ncbi:MULTISPECIES: hypothetical protein [unclassified Kitasatospora]